MPKPIDSGLIPPPPAQGPVAVGRVQLADLHRTTPISRYWGFDRGTPVDRRFIEEFLDKNRCDILGRVLEIGDDSYTRRFGGDRVTVRDVLHVKPDALGATIIGDLATADHIGSSLFDCIILTQTLHLIYDFKAAMATVRRILKPGGVLLATVPGITQIDVDEWRDDWYWSFTPRSVDRLFKEYFAHPDVVIQAHGNVLLAVAFLHGIAAEELSAGDFALHDPAYPIVITARAVKR